MLCLSKSTSSHSTRLHHTPVVSGTGTALEAQPLDELELEPEDELEDGDAEFKSLCSSSSTPTGAGAAVGAATAVIAGAGAACAAGHGGHGALAFAFAFTITGPSYTRVSDVFSPRAHVLLTIIVVVVKISSSHSLESLLLG